MPIFEYQCKECTKITTELFLGREEPHCVCPYCGAIVKKIISASNFKVNGYNYKNGYGVKK